MNRDARGKPLIFAADDLGSCDSTRNTNGGNVDIYLQGGDNKMVGQVTGLCSPAGLATDASGDLYVADEGHSAVPVYAPPYTGAPALTLDDTGALPYDVAVSPKGVVGVVNIICSTPSCGATGNVTFYAKNSTTPCVIVSNPNFFVSNGGFDKKGNLYVDGFGGPPSYSSAIGEIKGGCHANKIIPLTTTNTLGFLSYIKVDKEGRIAIYDYHESANTVIDTYNPPNHGSLGSPVSSISLSGLLRSYAFTFRGSGSEIYVGAANSSSYEVVGFGYPGGTEKKAFNAGGGTGMAATPPLIP